MVNIKIQFTNSDSNNIIMYCPKCHKQELQGKDGSGDPVNAVKVYTICGDCYHHHPDGGFREEIFFDQYGSIIKKSYASYPRSNPINQRQDRTLSNDIIYVTNVTNYDFNRRIKRNHRYGDEYTIPEFFRMVYKGDIDE